MKKGLLTAVAGLLTLGSVATTPAFAWNADRLPRHESAAPYHHVGHGWYGGHRPGHSPGGPGWYPGRHGWYPGRHGWYRSHGYRRYHGGYHR
jgi:hypothetical protein